MVFLQNQLENFWERGDYVSKFTSYRIEPEQAGLLLEDYLKQILQFSGRRVQRLTRQKGILLNGRVAFLQKKLKAGDQLKIKIETDEAYGVEPEAGPVEILYEDEFMLVLNKPPRQLVHPAGQTAAGTLANYLAYEFQQRGVCSAIRSLHRLDRDTSGCIIFAKDANSQFLLEQQLKDKRLQRYYTALTAGCPEPGKGVIDDPIGRDPARPNRRAVRKDGDPASTLYRVVFSAGGMSQLELTLLTGRTHQIRVHLAHILCPILGDGMYGRRSPWISRQALHASKITFYRLSDQKEITVEASLPQDFRQALRHFEEE